MVKVSVCHSIAALLLHLGLRLFVHHFTATKYAWCIWRRIRINTEAVRRGFLSCRWKSWVGVVDTSASRKPVLFTGWAWRPTCLEGGRSFGTRHQVWILRAALRGLMEVRPRMTRGLRHQLIIVLDGGNQARCVSVSLGAHQRLNQVWTIILLVIWLLSSAQSRYLAVVGLLIWVIAVHTERIVTILQVLSF